LRDKKSHSHIQNAKKYDRRNPNRKGTLDRRTTAATTQQTK
jgi:hypothetical protein